MGEPRFRSRVLILGASNVRRSLIPLIELAFAQFPRPLDLLLCCGHGRSYCRPNRVLGWSLPGLADSSWVPSWLTDNDVPRYAIVTDVGNDLLYGIDAEELTNHVERCLDVMHSHDRVIVMGLPMERLALISRWQFFIFKKIFFPGSQISLKSAIDAATRVDERLQRIAHARSLEWFSPPLKWYGMDPIHIRNRHQKSAWSRVFRRLIANSNSNAIDTLPNDFEEPFTLDSYSRILTSQNRFHLAFSRASQQSWLGWNRDQKQPVLRFSDGSTLSLY